MCQAATTTKNTARLIKDNLAGFQGHAALYRLSKPLEGHRHVIVSAVVAMFSGPETFIFPATKAGEVTNYGELEGSYRGGLDHRRAIEGAGYRLVDR